MARLLAPRGRDAINFPSSTVMNFCPESEGMTRCLLLAHSSRGLGHLPLKEEITGSNPVCATKAKETAYSIELASE